MPTLSERLLFFLAKRLYRSELAHSSTMKEAMSDRDKCSTYRASRIDLLSTKLRRYGIDLTDRIVLDLGCSDGAITSQYLECGAQKVIGVDIDEKAISRARQHRSADNVEYLVSTTDRIPLPNDSVDVSVCYDVFEHVARPKQMLDEAHRVLRSGGKLLIGTWGWYHPFATHLWATMPVPWAHVFFSERTLLRVCRRVYTSPWYVPTYHDLDEKGEKVPHRYTEEAIPLDYLNKLLIRDYEKLFRATPFSYRLHAEPFKARSARWTKIFLRVPWLREFITSSIWVVLEKKAAAEAAGASEWSQQTAQLPGGPG